MQTHWEKDYPNTPLYLSLFSTSTKKKMSGGVKSLKEGFMTDKIITYGKLISRNPTPFSLHSHPLVMYCIVTICIYPLKPGWTGLFIHLYTKYPRPLFLPSGDGLFGKLTDHIEKVVGGGWGMVSPNSTSYAFVCLFNIVKG